jgi:hypothetical protein
LHAAASSPKIRRSCVSDTSGYGNLYLMDTPGCDTLAPDA